MTAHSGTGRRATGSHIPYGGPIPGDNTDPRSRRSGRVADGAKPVESLPLDLESRLDAAQVARLRALLAEQRRESDAGW